MLLVKTPIESVTHQPGDVALCTPASRCTSHWRKRMGTSAWFTCRETARRTICEERIPASRQEAIFPPGSYLFTVREYAPGTVRVSLVVTLVDGP